METYKVRKGDNTITLDIRVKEYPSLDENWVCTSYLYKDIRDGNKPVVTRVFSRRTSLDGYDVEFKSTDLDIKSIVPGTTYDWVIVVENPTIGYSKTILNKLEVQYNVTK